MLYRELAPISNEAWDEIDKRAREVLKAYLSARKVVKVNGPKGIDFNVITEGRLSNINELENKIGYANYEVQPLTEARIEFEMGRWELDNIGRGAKDVDFEPLENAMKELALFEENAIYNGLENTMIKGIDQDAKVSIPFGDDPSSIMEAITKGVIQLRKSFEPGPFTLVVNEEVYKRILSKDTAFPLDEKIKKLIGGKILLSHAIDGAYLLPYNHDDLELTIGQDFSIGYQSSDLNNIRFFASESFTFRVLNPDLIVKFTI